jgi:ABC-type uncharacterized transport system involved in gliding motility auxiliary subunit
MSFWGKVLLGLSAFCLIILLSTRYVLGGWLDWMWVPLGAFAAAAVAALAVDYRSVVDFFTMRTTRHGLNMGTLILLTLVGLGVVNFMAARYDKTWDMTAEGLNSLSEQSLDLLRKLDEELTIKVFYRGQQDMPARQQVKPLLQMFADASHRVRIDYVDAYRNPGEARSYFQDSNVEAQARMQLFLVYKGRRIPIDGGGPEGLAEDVVTKALVSATRSGARKILFVEGHGEPSINAPPSDRLSLSLLRDALTDLSFEVDSINLMTADIPEKVDVLAIAGPKTQFAENEMAKIKAYLARGGQLFLALDPGMRHNMGEFARRLGVEFHNNYIIDPADPVGAGFVVDVVYDTNNDWTKNFTGKQALFHLMSEVSKVAVADPELKVTEVMRSSAGSVVISELRDQQVSGPRQSRPAAVTSSGVFKPLKDDKIAPVAEGAKPPEFTALIVGDSDFLRNEFFNQLFNRDLSVNAFAFLTRDTELISIRPKRPQTTSIRMTRQQRLAVVGGAILLPIAIFGFGLVTWFRRRGA